MESTCFGHLIVSTIECAKHFDSVGLHLLPTVIVLTSGPFVALEFVILDAHSIKNSFFTLNNQPLMLLDSIGLRGDHIREKQRHCRHTIVEIRQW